jgi:FkbM family methyltransferase
LPRFPLSQLRWIVEKRQKLAMPAPSRVAELLNSIAIVLVSAQDRGWIPVRTRTLHLSYRGLAFRLKVANRSEIDVAREMFLEEQYLIPGIDPKLILDLGSNIGASIMFFRAQYPSARILGLEPDPDTFQRLAATVAPVSDVNVYPWAAYGQSGHVGFVQERQSWDSAIASDGEAYTVKVEAVSLRDIFARLGIEHVDLLKFDIQGSEWSIFNDPSAFAACDTIVGELHLDRPDQTVERAQQALSGFMLTISERSAGLVNFVARRAT